jgi:hypothetical protein
MIKMNLAMTYLKGQCSAINCTRKGDRDHVETSEKANDKFPPKNYPFALEEKKLVLLNNQPIYGSNVLLSNSDILPKCYIT